MVACMHGRLHHSERLATAVSAIGWALPLPLSGLGFLLALVEHTHLAATSSSPVAQMWLVAEGAHTPAGQMALMLQSGQRQGT